MRAHKLIGIASLAALSACGLEGFFGNVTHVANERPASAMVGAAAYPGAATSSVTVVDGEGTDLAPFQSTVTAGAYDVRLPSSNYSMIRVQARSGDLLLRALVPEIGEESVAAGVDLDARNMTEALIVEARLSHDQVPFKTLTPAAYVGDGVTSGTRTLIRAAFEVPGPTQDLLRMVERLMAATDPFSGASNPGFFTPPVLDTSWNVTTSPVDGVWLQLELMDYTGDGLVDRDNLAFNAALVAAAKLYDPTGCVDATHVRLVFSVDFNDGCLDGTCRSFNKLKWVVSKPDKTMYFVGWVHEESEVQDQAITAMLGNSAPNNIQMYDDGTNGDEVGDDGIYTVAFAVPYDPTRVLRIGYKYTWGLRGQVWTGSEEWPGNSRILEVVDVNGDAFVYRRDVFGDEATNKDRSNLHPASGGSLTWDEDLHGCGPEAREQMFSLHNACQCGTEWFTPSAIGPVRIACTE